MRVAIPFSPIWGMTDIGWAYMVPAYAYTAFTASQYGVPKMTAHQAPRPELCSARYSATLVPVPDGTPKIFITAQGVHPTSGYEVIFHVSPIDVFPPQFSLWHLTPSGPVLEVLTPFSKFTAFDAKETVRTVEIVDASGRHTVEVRPLA